MEHEARGPQSRNQIGGNDTTAIDEYLFSCGHDRAAIDWDRLYLTAQRVVVRLLTDARARTSHLMRLRDDGDLYCDSSDTRDFGSVEQICGQDPYKADVGTADYLVILRDGFHLDLAAAIILGERGAHPGWVKEMVRRKEACCSGDRDDRVAARLYEISKLLPSLDAE